MLGATYPQLLARLISRTEWNIQLPAGRMQFFQETGFAPSVPSDGRCGGRVRVRTRGIAICEQGLPAIPRRQESLGIFTSDFSRQGFGFVADRQFYPTETVRILLPTFWMRVTVVRSRRLGERCFENGALLSQQLDPSPEAFCGLTEELALPAS